MNKQQKKVIQHQLTMENLVLDLLKKQYEAALKDIKLKIRMLQSDPLTQSRIYRLEYQKALKKQIEAALEKLHSDEYTTIQQYLSDSYTDAFVGTFYDLHGQGVPVIAPIDQNAAIKAVMTDSKLKKKLYDELGVDINKLKRSVSEEISRGIASGLLYDEIARNIQFHTNAPFSRAKTIVRTEGHRIQEASANDARELAKSKGADVVKQWDATLDGKTRPTHRQLDGQIREVDEPFELGTKKAMYPGGFGIAAEDCNCRCVALTRARAALDEEELKILRERAVRHSLYMDDPKAYRADKLPTLKNFEEFKKSYLKAAETLMKQGESGIMNRVEDGFYNKLTSEEIATRYIKKDGSNLLDKSFLSIPIEMQREVVRGYDFAINLFGDIMPQRIKAANLKSGAFAEYSTTFKTITFNHHKQKALQEACGTAIHEMTHHAENIGLYKSEDVLKAAIKKTGYKSNSKMVRAWKSLIVGPYNKKDADDPHEIVAFAMEKVAFGYQNPLAEAIHSVLKGEEE